MFEWFRQFRINRFRRWLDNNCFDIDGYDDNDIERILNNSYTRYPWY